MASIKQKVTSKAIEIIKANGGGIRLSELTRRLQGEFPNDSVNTIASYAWDLDAQVPDEVYKPARGVFRHVSFKQQPSSEEEEDIVPLLERQPEAANKVAESDFYQPFADYLVNDLEECTKAVALGGNRFKEKWGTPDVVGIREPRKRDLVKPPLEIVSAEIKTDTGNLITAFGQAVLL